MVTVDPEMVARPEVTLYVMAPLDAELALTAKGATPYAFAEIVVNVSVGVAFRVNVAVAFTDVFA
jgi:hypothetical protein